MCHAAKNSGMPHHGYNDRKKENNIFMHAHVAPWSLLHSTPFLHYSCVPGRVGHTANLIKSEPAIFEKWAFKFLMDTKRTKVSPLCLHCTYYGMSKGTCWAEVMSSSKKIKPVSPTIIKLSLIKGVQSARQ